jgi:cytochrome c
MTMAPGKIAPRLPRLGPALALALAMVAVPAAATDTARGVVVFKRCALCHSVDPGKRGAVGPGLWGIVGRKAASSDFAYSTALKASGIVWTTDTLDGFLTKPSAKVPGNRMTFAGIADAGERSDVIAYLATLK